MSFQFIREYADRWPIRLMCRVLDVLIIRRGRHIPEAIRARCHLVEADQGATAYFS